MNESRSPAQSARRLFVGGVVSMTVSLLVVAGLLARKAGLVSAEGRARAADVAAGPPVPVVRVMGPDGGRPLRPVGGAPPPPPLPPPPHIPPPLPPRPSAT